MTPATSNLACSWGLQRPITKSHSEEKLVWPWAKKTSQNLGVRDSCQRVRRRHCHTPLALAHAALLARVQNRIGR